MAGSPHARPAPKISTRSMRRASGEPIICSVSLSRRKQSSRMRLPRHRRAMPGKCDRPAEALPAVNQSGGREVWLNIMNDECVLHECAVALLLIDVINDLEFEEGKALMRAALPAAGNIERLKQEA